MSEAQTLRKRRKQILVELEQLEEIRRGSMVSQYMITERKDGSKSKRGPYRLYSYKEKGKTISKRISNPQEAEIYERQIDGFRRFQQLTSELVSIGERLSALAVQDEELKKTLGSN